MLFVLHIYFYVNSVSLKVSVWLCVKKLGDFIIIHTVTFLHNLSLNWNHDCFFFCEWDYMPLSSFTLLS